MRKQDEDVVDLIVEKVSVPLRGLDMRKLFYLEYAEERLLQVSVPLRGLDMRKHRW